MARMYFFHENLRGVEINSNEEIKQYIQEGLIIPFEGVTVTDSELKMEETKKPVFITQLKP